MLQPEPTGDTCRLGRALVRPGFHEADNIRTDLGESFFNPFLTLLPIVAIATPDIPCDDTNRRFNKRTVWCVWVKCHSKSMPAPPRSEAPECRLPIDSGRPTLSNVRARA
jgi:hypothetical protein